MKGYLIVNVQFCERLERLAPFDADPHLADVPHSDVGHAGRVELLEDRGRLQVDID